MLGTGKTTTARKFGQVYYDLGFLSQVEVVECSAKDLTGEYVGQTGPKIIQQLEKGLGKVLFIDEAYSLIEGGYGQEAVNMLVDTITKPRFAGKLVIILAGYDDAMNKLLQFNQGLSSRFREEVLFTSLSASHCLQLLKEKLKQSAIAFPSLHGTSMNTYLLDSIKDLSKLPGWGNARDIDTLAQSMVRTAYENSTDEVDLPVLQAEDAKGCVESMLLQSRQRTHHEVIPQYLHSGQVPAQVSAPNYGTQVSSSTSATARPVPEPESHGETTQKASVDDGECRDPGVSDAVWERLQIDEKIAEAKAEQARKDILKQEEAHRLAQKAEAEAKEHAVALLEIQAKDEAEADELLRKREEARIREIEARAESERIQREVERLRKEEMERRKKEERAQVKLRKMGICPAGFRWIKQGSGYRCAGGAHWVSDASLGL